MNIKKKKPSGKEPKLYKCKKKLPTFQNEKDNISDYTMHINPKYIVENQELNENKKEKNNNNKLNSIDYIKILNINSEKQFNNGFFNNKKNNDYINSFIYMQQDNDVLDSNLSIGKNIYIPKYLINKGKNKSNNENLMGYNSKKKDTYFKHISKNRDTNIISTFKDFIFNEDKNNVISGEVNILKKKKKKINKDNNNKNDRIEDKIMYEYKNFKADMSSNFSYNNQHNAQIRNSSDENKLRRKKNIFNANLRDTQIFDEKKKLKNKKYSFNVKTSGKKKNHENIKNNYETETKDQKKFQNTLKNFSEEVRKENMTSSDENESIREMKINKKESCGKNKSLKMENNDNLREKIRCKFKLKKLNKSIRSQTNSSNNLSKKSLDNLNEVLSYNSNKKPLDTLNKNSQDNLYVDLRQKKITNKELDNLIENEKEKKNKEYFLNKKVKEKYLRKKENNNNNDGNIICTNKFFNNKGNYYNKNININKKIEIKNIDNSKDLSNKKDKKNNYYHDEYSKLEMKEINNIAYKFMNKKNHIYPKKYTMELIKNSKYLDQRMKNYINEQIKYYGEDLRKDNIENIYLYITKNFEKKNLGQVTKRNDNTILTNSVKKKYNKKLDENSDNINYDMSSNIELLPLIDKEIYSKISASSFKEVKKYINAIDVLKKTYNDYHDNKIKNDSVCDSNSTEKNEVYKKKKKEKNCNLTKKNNSKESKKFKLDKKKFISFSEMYSYLKNEKNILEKMFNEEEKKNLRCHLEELNEIEKKMIKFIENFEQIITRKEDKKHIFSDNTYKRGTTFQINALLKILDEIIQIVNDQFNSTKKIPYYKFLESFKKNKTSSFYL
ncbi:conserved Plasmodium protein, unknown function [Plasmodium relictum]|uniref:Uncharacterized protein n=1 Tax=Plasmodium relictum TaxID=85471 RepID=A0A1J1HDE0_PLARL|nr:conserved Plasmodium protein, unknown function [Plasmodium relictum]CRH04001.1 conserved Plasmodium protein, unknown function [Plasmodium relictum]